MKKRVLAILMAVAVTGSLAACGDSAPAQADSSAVAETQAEEKEETESAEAAVAAVANDGEQIETVAGSWLKFGCMSDPKTFGPWDGGGGGRNMVNMSAYETLAYMKADGSMSNCIMKEYTNPSDGVYDITIYDYVHDSIGNPITAADVVFSFEKCAEFGNWATYTAAMESVKEIDEYTVEIVLDNERPDTFSGLLENVMIVSQKSYEESADAMASAPIGTGAYVLEEYVPGASMTFVVNDDYWQTDASLVASQSVHNVERYTIEIITNKSQHSIALETGELDCSNSVLSVDYTNFLEADDVTAKDGYAYIESEKQGITSLIFNCSDDSICSDVNLRKAIAYAIDSASLAYAAYGSAGFGCTSFSQTTHFDHDDIYVPDEGYFNYDEETAKSYLEESDYSGETIKLYAQNDTEIAVQCELVRSYCEAVGINVSVKTFDSALFDSYLYDSDPEWDMAFCFCEGGDYTYVSVAWCVDLNYYTSGVNNLQIRDDQLQSLFDEAVSVSTFSHENTKKLLDYITDNCYMVAMTGFKQKVFYNSNTIEFLGTTKTGFDPVPGACVVTSK